MAAASHAHVCAGWYGAEGATAAAMLVVVGELQYVCAHGRGLGWSEMVRS